jgi:hypothetical protein
MAEQRSVVAFEANSEPGLSIDERPAEDPDGLDWAVAD